MESVGTKENGKPYAENENVNINSVENFQKCIYDLFEKNGILNDLRAYLRGHIVSVLRNAKTGEPPACQKLFTQRLEHNYQALNMLIVEYFMRLEFSYSLSVFVSEIPLNNMVFEFAKTLMQNCADNVTEAKFSDHDVWSILNYLEVQCDSDHALRIADMYRSDKKTSLLLCILKCLPMYHKDREMSSKDTLSTGKSSNADQPPTTVKCKHIKYCTTCQTRMMGHRNEYKKKKKYLYKNVKSIVKPVKFDAVVKNVGFLERSLIEEMFQELKSVYETEMGIVKQEEEKKLKRCMTNQALLLQRQQNELIESFKAREEAMEANLTQKKKFLWGLARSLRDQHQQLAAALRAVSADAQRLRGEEESLKTQMAEAEEILKKRGEEMRVQISEELKVLEGHLTAMKKERDSINKEREELEKLKNIENTNKVMNMHNITSTTHYDLLKNELDILKNYLESSQFTPKCVIEKGTMTEPSDEMPYSGLNNSHTADKSKNGDDKLMNQVVNDFKKKNVNVTPTKLYRDHNHSSGSSEAGDSARNKHTLQRLRHENCRLRAYAKQQKCQLEAMARDAQLPRARPAAAPRAPAAPPLHNCLLTSVNTNATANIHASMSVGWRKGAGEELSMYRDTQPRVLLPGDEIPFVGVLRDKERHVTRRQLLGQRGRGAASSDPQASCATQLGDKSHDSLKPVCLKSYSNREKSPKSVLREAKKKLRNIKDTSVVSCEKSPSSVLREAKLRLRKLEIEAEAVEQSYLHYRRKQSQRREERGLDEDVAEGERTLDLKESHSKLNLKDSGRKATDLTDFKKKFDKYLRDYKTDQEQTQATTKIHSEEISKETCNNLIETPLAEFRQLYYAKRQAEDEQMCDEYENKARSNASEVSAHDSVDCDVSRCITPTKQCEKQNEGDSFSLDILERNVNKIRNLDDVVSAQQSDINVQEVKNLLRIEIESINEQKAVSEDLSLVVQNSIDIQEVNVPQNDTHISDQITIIVSPRESGEKSGEDIKLDEPCEPIRSSSPEQEARLTRNDVLDAIFNENSNDLVEQAAKESLNESIDEDDDFPDNFSADVDNYNSRSESRSPISLLKTSEDEIWDV